MQNCCFWAAQGDGVLLLCCCDFSHYVRVMPCLSYQMLGNFGLIPNHKSICSCIFLWSVSWFLLGLCLRVHFSKLRIHIVCKFPLLVTMIGLCLQTDFIFLKVMTNIIQLYIPNCYLEHNLCSENVLLNEEMNISELISQLTTCIKISAGRISFIIFKKLLLNFKSHWIIS